MAVFPLLADPSSYRACDTDLVVDRRCLAHWLSIFGAHLEIQLAAAAVGGIAPEVRQAARAEFLQELELIRGDPARHGRLDIMLLDELRGATLRRHGIDDEFRHIKQRENELALVALPGHLAAVDATPLPQRLELLARSVLAGNLFDMGVPGTAARFVDAPIEFDCLLETVPPRPWFIDELDRAQRWWQDAPPGRVVIFADNAGPDAVLGVLPLARELLRRGDTVVLAANRRPCLNDVTAAELTDLCRRAGRLDQLLAGDRLHLVCSGSDGPLIDLSDVSEQLAEAATGAALVVLVGMGRALESNRTARFRCPCWRIAMVKDPMVADGMGAQVGDAVFGAGSD